MTELAVALALVAATGFAPEPYRWLGRVAVSSTAMAGFVAGASMRKAEAPPPSMEVAPRAPKK